MNAAEIKNIVNTLSGIPDIPEHQVKPVFKKGKPVVVGRGGEATVTLVEYKGQKCASKRISGKTLATITSCGVSSETLRNMLHNTTTRTVCSGRGGRPTTNRQTPYELLIFNRMRSVHHPNIIRLLGKCVTEEVTEKFGQQHVEYEITLIMQLCEGDLRDVMASNKDLPAERVVAWLTQITSAMIHLHEMMRIYHGDLKPENILVTSDLVCKVSDFGQAVDVSVLTEQAKTHMARGFTLFYKAPELYSMKKLVLADQMKSDIYSMIQIFFDVLYRCSRASTCFGGNATGDQVAALVISNNRPELDQELPWLYRYLLFLGWQDEAADRPDSVDILTILQCAYAFMDDLETWVSNLSAFQKETYKFGQCPTAMELLAENSQDSELVSITKEMFRRKLRSSQSISTALSSMSLSTHLVTSHPNAVQSTNPTTQKSVPVTSTHPLSTVRAVSRATPQPKVAKSEFEKLAKYFPSDWENLYSESKFSDIFCYRDKDNDTPKHYAACMSPSDFRNMLDLMERCNVPLDLEDGGFKNRTVLSRSYKYLTSLQLVLSKGVDLNARDDHNEMVTHLVCQYGSVDILKFLEDYSTQSGKTFDIEARGFTGRTLLAKVAEGKTYDGLKKMEYLLQKGADVDAVDDNMDSISSLACQFGTPDVAKKLFQLILNGKTKLDLGFRNIRGRDCLMVVSKKGRADIVEILLNDKYNKVGVDPTNSCSKGKTALHYSCYHQDADWNGGIDAAKLLVSASPRCLFVKCNANKKPLDYVKTRTYDQVKDKEFVDYIKAMMKKYAHLEN